MNHVRIYKYSTCIVLQKHRLNRKTTIERKVTSESNQIYHII